MLTRGFSKNSARTDPMAGRFKPKHILNFGKDDRYLLYNSKFRSAAREKKYTHPKSISLYMALGFGICILSSALYIAKLVAKTGDFWTHRYKIIISMCFGVASARAMRKMLRQFVIIQSISLRPCGKSVDIACHAPFYSSISDIPIKNLKFHRGDDLARMLRQQDHFIDKRCIPVTIKGI